MWPNGAVDEAVIIADHTGIGFGGLVFGRHRRVAQAVAERIDCGSVGGNFLASLHEAPSAVRREASPGVENGDEGLNRCVPFTSVYRRMW